jgi:hypothetical protein
MPERIQLRRTKGWRKPAGAVVVSRPSRFGNPWLVKQDGGRWLVVAAGGRGIDVDDGAEYFPDEATAHQRSVELYRRYVERDPVLRQKIIDELAGRDLACWCRAGLSCHVDVLLAIANGGRDN